MCIYCDCLLSVIVMSWVLGDAWSVDKRAEADSFVYFIFGLQIFGQTTCFVTRECAKIKQVKLGSTKISFSQRSFDISILFFIEQICLFRSKKAFSKTRSSISSIQTNAQSRGSVRMHARILYFIVLSCFEF